MKVSDVEKVLEEAGIPKYIFGEDKWSPEARKEFINQVASIILVNPRKKKEDE